jgi:hypothetical protein
VSAANPASAAWPGIEDLEGNQLGRFQTSPICKLDGNAR